jgi:hypothetical protein
MTLQADRAYAKTRVDLEQFERAAFAALRSFVPNFFRDGRDDTLYGHHLRGIAREMARQDYWNQYELFGHDPRYLNAADLLRQYGGPLRLNRNYPGTTQYDLDFKQMVLKLLEAYRLGATTKSIEKVIEAFTGESFEVEELFKSIGTYYDVSDRHAIRIGVKVAQTQAGITANVANDVARVRDLVVDLYTAIDLAKPAHVGINLTTVMGLDEDIDALVMAITDEVRIIMLLEEAEPGDPMLHQASFLDPKTPDTGLAPAIQNFVYQWFKNGTAIPGATGPDYTTPITALADNNTEFQVRIVDTPAAGAIKGLGTVWSQRAILTVHPTGTTPLPRSTKALPATQTSTGALVIHTEPFSRSVIEGQTVMFSVVAANRTTPGLLSPHLNRVWEVPGGDELRGLDLD